MIMYFLLMPVIGDLGLGRKHESVLLPSQYAFKQSTPISVSFFIHLKLISLKYVF